MLSVTFMLCDTPNDTSYALYAWQGAKNRLRIRDAQANLLYSVILPQTCNL